MKTILKYISHIALFVALLLSFVYAASQFGVFHVYDTNGKLVSSYPFSTESVVREQADKKCGVGCTIVRIK